MNLTTAVPAAPHDAFAAIGDFANVAAWDPFVRTSALVEGRSLEPGAVYAITAVGGMTLRSIVVDASPPTSITYQGGTRNVTSTDRISIAASADGSTVTIRSELEFRGWTKLVGWLIRPAVSLGGRLVSLPALRRHLGVR